MRYLIFTATIALIASIAHCTKNEPPPDELFLRIDGQLRPGHKLDDNIFIDAITGQVSLAM